MGPDNNEYIYGKQQSHSCERHQAARKRNNRRIVVLNSLTHDSNAAGIWYNNNGKRSEQQSLRAARAGFEKLNKMLSESDPTLNTIVNKFYNTSLQTETNRAI